MANHKSAIKRARQNIKRRLRNRTLRSVYRTKIRQFVGLIEKNELEEAKNELPKLYKVIDKTRSKGVIHKNTASRNKSRLTALLNKVLNAA